MAHDPFEAVENRLMRGMRGPGPKEADIVILRRGILRAWTKKEKVKALRVGQVLRVV